MLLFHIKRCCQARVKIGRSLSGIALLLLITQYHWQRLDVSHGLYIANSKFQLILLHVHVFVFLKLSLLINLPAGNPETYIGRFSINYM